MKKSLVAAAVVVAMGLLAGCGSNEKVISGDVNNNPAAATEVMADEAAAEVTTNGYVFTSAGTDVVIDAKAEPIIAALGEPVTYFEATSCAFGDLDKTYTYRGFEVDTYSLEGVDYVSAVVLLDDSVTTPEGLAIGDSASKVAEVYGEATQDTGSMLVFKKDKMKLDIQITDDAVTSIQYLNTILDEQ